MEVRKASHRSPGGGLRVSARPPSSGRGHHHRDDTIQWGLAVPPASSPRSRDVNNATRAGLPHDKLILENSPTAASSTL